MTVELFNLSVLLLEYLMLQCKLVFVFTQLVFHDNHQHTEKGMLQREHQKSNRSILCIFFDKKIQEMTDNTITMTSKFYRTFYSCNVTLLIFPSKFPETIAAKTFALLIMSTRMYLNITDISTWQCGKLY